MTPPHPDLRTAARTALARELVDLSDYTAALADLLIDDVGFAHGELVHCARRVAVARLRLLTWALRAERADGASWPLLADALGERRTLDQVEGFYGPGVDGWLTDPASVGAPVLPGLDARLGVYLSRIPTEWRSAREWLVRWRARRAERAAAESGSVR